MQTLLDFFHQLQDPRVLVQAAGYVGLTAIIFAETGLLIGFFLPGDSVLVTAGLLATQSQFGLNVWLLGVLLTIAAVLGNSLGYAIGRFTGPRLFTRDDSLLFKKKHLFRCQHRDVVFVAFERISAIPIEADYTVEIDHPCIVL